MATALPSTDPGGQSRGREAIRKDKEWEAAQGFLRGWVAHIFHMKTAADPFKTLIASGFQAHAGDGEARQLPGAGRRCRPAGHPRGDTPQTRAWSSSTSRAGSTAAAPRASTASRASRACTPPSWRTVATGRMSVAQIAQRVRHRAPTTEGPSATHDTALVKRLLQEEVDDILARRPKDAATQERYRKAVKIAMRWIKNYHRSRLPLARLVHARRPRSQSHARPTRSERAAGVAPGGAGPCSTTQIDDALRLSAGHDAQPEPTQYPEDTGLTRPRPAGTTQRAGRVRPRKSTMGSRLSAGHDGSAGTDAIPRRHGSHTAPPRRHHPACGPCSTTQIDDGSRLSAGHGAQPEPTQYPEDTGSHTAPPRPGTTSVRTL